jgi:Sulfotransferase domain
VKLIGAGLPRTATTSQKIALEMLGLGPCYHMVNVLGDLSLVPRWRRVLAGEVSWPEMFDGFQATVDWPGAYFYQELMQVYPEAKVVLSTREPEGWERSMRQTIWDVLYGDSLARDLCVARERVEPLWRQYNELMREMWDRAGLLSAVGTHEPVGAAMLSYNQEVQRNVPPDRLLVWSAAEGWEPLCRFLEVPVPEAPFPHVNDSQMFTERLIEAALHSLNGWWAETHAEATAAVS